MDEFEFVSNMTVEEKYIGYLMPLTIYIWVACILACILNVMLYPALQKMKVLPSTVLLQFKHLAVVCSALSILNIILYGIPLLMIQINGKFPSINRILCAFWAIPSNSLGSLLLVLYSALALERWNATKNEIQATKEGDPRVMKKILLALWLLNLTSNTLFSASQISDNIADRRMCGFATVFVPPMLLYFLLLVFVGSEICLAGLYITVWLRNRHNLHDFSLRTTRYSVIERYQIRQTLKSFRMVAPSLLINMFVVLCIAMSMVYYSYHLSDTLQVEVGLALCLPVLQPVYLILHPISLFIFEQDLRKNVRSCIKSINTVDVQPTTARNPVVKYAVTPGNHAVMLEDFWDKAKP